MNLAKMISIPLMLHFYRYQYHIPYQCKLLKNYSCMLRIHQNLLPTLFEQFVFFHNRKWLRIIKCNYFFKCKLPSFFSRCVRGYCTGIIFIKCRTHYVDQTLNLTNAIIVIWDNNVRNTGYRVLIVWMNSIIDLNQIYRNMQS